MIADPSGDDIPEEHRDVPPDGLSGSGGTGETRLHYRAISSKSPQTLSRGAAVRLEPV
ncbi:MAG: hypothetical protein WC832_08855 [Anaerolineales bacterium]